MTSVEARTVAFMDIGTNSIRLLLVRLHPNHSHTILTELRQIVRLGDGEFASKHLQPAAMERTVLVAKEFAELARANGADEIVAVATAATREADNQAAFVQRLQAEVQLDVRVIAGLEEARLIYLGVSHGVHLGDKQAFFIDIGGGQHGSDHWRSAPVCLRRVTEIGRHPSHHTLPDRRAWSCATPEVRCHPTLRAPPCRAHTARDAALSS